MKSKKPTVSDEDKALFRSHIGKVERLHYTQSAITPQKTKPPVRNPRKPVLARQNLSTVDRHQEMPLYDHEDPVTSEESLYFNRGGLQEKPLRKLKRGQFPSEAELDLHGLTAAEAYQELTAFLERCNHQNFRHLRIIHGKGHTGQSPYPVLKNKVNNWLRGFPQVLAFSSATKSDGGAGVVYVLLRAKTV
jgi:DNA-nicking Smr family endonuclease